MTLCFQNRQGPHVLTCIGKLWLAACSSKVWEASTAKVSTNLLGATVAVAGDPGLLPLPSSCVKSSPDEEAELLPEPSDSDKAARGDGVAADGDAVAAVAADSDSDSGPSGSEPASRKDASSNVALTEELALGEGLAATLEDDDIAAVVPPESHRR